jgi:hypothetical protein
VAESLIFLLYDHQEVFCLNPTTGPEMKSQKVAINLMTDVSFD